MIKRDDVHVQLTGTDGNVFALLGRCTKALRRAGYADTATELTNAVLNSGSYAEALNHMSEAVEVS